MLKDMKPRTIDRNTPPLAAVETQKCLNETPGWDVQGSVITRVFQFANFRKAMKFVNRVARIADKMDHHPEIKISYNRVELELTTHKIGGLSMNDFIQAAKINRIAK